MKSLIHSSDFEKKKQFFSKQQTEWWKICAYLSSLTDVKTKVCVGCNVSKIYNNNGKEFVVTRKNSLDEVQKLVENIRSENG